MPRDIPAHIRWVQTDEHEAVDLNKPYMRALTQAGLDIDPDCTLETAAMLADHTLDLVRRAGLTVTEHVPHPRIRNG
jgi:hypothetical protein